MSPRWRRERPRWSRVAFRQAAERALAPIPARGSSTQWRKALAPGANSSLFQDDDAVYVVCDPVFQSNASRDISGLGSRGGDRRRFGQLVERRLRFIQAWKLRTRFHGASEIIARVRSITGH